MNALRYRLIVAALLVCLFAVGAVVKSVSSTPVLPVGAVMCGTSGGILAAEPAGEWVTSAWPTTRYYTTRYQAAVWAEWAPGNRVWFRSETELLQAYPGREKR